VTRTALVISVEVSVTASNRPIRGATLTLEPSLFPAIASADDPGTGTPCRAPVESGATSFVAS